MAYFDDVKAERQQWAAEERQARQDSTTTPATSTVRTQAGWILAIGIPCLFPPATPLGVFLVAALMNAAAAVMAWLVLRPMRRAHFAKAQHAPAIAVLVS